MILIVSLMGICDMKLKKKFNQHRPVYSAAINRAHTNRESEYLLIKQNILSESRAKEKRKSTGKDEYKVAPDSKSHAKEVYRHEEINSSKHSKCGYQMKVSSQLHISVAFPLEKSSWV
jgi:hypothetical protein